MAGEARSARFVSRISHLRFERIFARNPPLMLHYTLAVILKNKKNMEKIRANSYNTGIASEYLVLSLIYRQGFEAYISLGNKKSIDIRVVKSELETLSIDVKSVRGYSSLVVNNVITAPNHFIIFVVYNNNFEDVKTHPDIFIVPSIELSTITETYEKEKRVLKGKLKSYKDRWDYISKGKQDNDY